MFIGHFAVAFASKKVAPKVSLGTLVIAAAFLDVVWPVLVLLGVERFRIVPVLPRSTRSISCITRGRTAC